MQQLSQDWGPVADVPNVDERAVAPAWGPVKKVLFRILFCYLFLYIFPFPLDLIPVAGEVLNTLYSALWHKAVPWVGESVFGVEIKFRPGGSGDTTYNYVQLFCYLVLALAVTAVWTVLDRKRTDYARLNEWLRVYVRFYLAVAMISYGAYKVIPSQFGDSPFPSKLLQPIGDSSPMGILWTFMGASLSYNVFTGLAEMLGGLLLAARRTALLGALVSIGVMGNVAMLNFSYDVPVKLFSSHLLLMAVVLAVPELRRLADLLVLNRRVEPSRSGPLFTGRKARRAALAFQTVFVLFVTGATLHQSYKWYTGLEVQAPKTKLYGIWNVEEFAVDGTVRPLLSTDDTVWRRLVFEWPGTIGIQPMHETEIRYYELKLEPGPRRFAMAKYDDPEWKAWLDYRLARPDVLTLECEMDGKRIRARFRKMDESRFLLVSRGFHWINELPFNR